MKAINKFFLVISIVALAASCKEEHTPQYDTEIRNRYFHLEHMGWKSKQHTQKADEINFTATEVPLPYYILKNQGTENLFEADSIYKANDTERIIEFEFLHDQEQDLLKGDYTSVSYEEAVKYMSFNIANDFYVVTSKNDTIKCTGANFERSFKVTPNNKVMLFFTGIPADDKIQLIYNDRLFNKGTFKFKFEDKITKILL